MPSLPRISDAERRRRIARRHALAPEHRVASVGDACRSVVALHATEGSTVHLAVAARSNQAVGDVERALYDDRTLVKQLAMRRTLWAFPRDLLPAAWGSASARVATSEGKRIAKAVEEAGLTDDGHAWLDAGGRAVLDRLAAGPASTSQLRESVPEIAGTYHRGSGKSWDRPVPVAPWVLTHLGLRAGVVRGDNAGHWRLNKPTWTRTQDWLGEAEPALSPDEGYAAIVARWLERFGPGTADDLQWWLGATKTAVRQALADVEAVEVALDDGSTGWVLPDDTGTGDTVEPWAALLPTLDPTTMGWKERAFYLDPAHRPYLFDTNGNGGTTAWWEGRIVGCWVQDPEGVVRLSLLGDVPPAGVRALEAEAARLTAFLDGVVVMNVYSSQQMKQARLP